MKILAALHNLYEETKLDLLRVKLAQGEEQLARGEGHNGEDFMQELMS